MFEIMLSLSRSNQQKRKKREKEATESASMCSLEEMNINLIMNIAIFAITQ